MIIKRKLFLLFLLLCFLQQSAEAGWLKLNHRRSGEENAQLVIKKVKDMSAEYNKLFDEAVAWAVFPSVGKAGFGLGGAAGNGRVYRKGKFIGTSTLSQIAVGFQFGGQVYSEIIFFQNDSVLERFKHGKTELGANASAVIANAGVAGSVGFKDGTVVLIIPKGGLMYEATVSGQKFTFKAVKSK